MFASAHTIFFQFENLGLPLYGYIMACIPDTCTPEYIERYLYEGRHRSVNSSTTYLQMMRLLIDDVMVFPDNVLFRIFLTSILDFDMFTEEVFCGKSGGAASDGGFVTCV